MHPDEAAHYEFLPMNLYYFRVATVREKYLENDFFPGQGKVREFCGWSGKFRKDLEVREKSGNLKIIG